VGEGYLPPMTGAVILKSAWREPLDVLSAFADEPWVCAFLSGGGGARARWSYILRDPEAVLTLSPSAPRDAFSALAAMIGPRQGASASQPPFQGGAAGLAVYELGDRVERLGLQRHPDWPDLALGRYSRLLAFDHQEREVLAIGPDGAQAAATAGWLQERGRAERDGPLTLAFDDHTPASAYEAAVAQVVGRIASGELFQANIARAWRGRLVTGAGPFDVLARLAGSSPAPFAAYMRLPERAVVSNSPERFLSVAAGDELTVETRPIKGTRPRGATAADDAALAAELLASAKDRAENLMIVDLMRNDLARVSPPGSVAAPELFKVESFTNVHHLVSTVTSRLAPGMGAADLLRAAFPPGSITGAPKVQAMKVISEMEGPRGPYCGSLLWAGFDGAFDSSVLIRTLSLVQDEAGWRFEAKAGAGIVADSDPVAERIETEDKIAAIRRALTGDGA
jgi:para-aminobenzoate synthetase component 1